MNLVAELELLFYGISGGRLKESGSGDKGIEIERKWKWR